MVDDKGGDRISLNLFDERIKVTKEGKFSRAESTSEKFVKKFESKFNVCNFGK